MRGSTANKIANKIENNELEQQFNSFISQGWRIGKSQILRSPVGVVYVRCSQRLKGGSFLEFFDIATVSMTNKGQGDFTRFLESAEQHSVNLFIENVMSERLQEFFDRRPDYVRMRSTDPFSVSFVRVQS